VLLLGRYRLAVIARAVSTIITHPGQLTPVNNEPFPLYTPTPVYSVRHMPASHLPSRRSACFQNTPENTGIAAACIDGEDYLLRR